MRRLAIVFAVLFVFSVSAYAQTGEGTALEDKGQMEPGMKGGMMQMCPMMMNHMMGQGMMTQEMMHMMMDMMKMQQKMMRGMKPQEKKQMMMDMDKMMERMDKMTGGMGMMGKGAAKANIKCAEEWLKKAIDLHEVHIKDPKTATDASQMEMMDQMKRAYECITATGPENAAKPSKKSKEGAKKKDEHGH